MNYLGISLTGYIGIYNGMGLDNLTISFEKCKHRKIAIIGDNGSGKSTLLNAISPFPDSNSNFIPGKSAEKKISIQDNEGIIYHIRYLHEFGSSRATTRGYIQKCYPGRKPVELNPTGNITSCREIVCSQLGLDPNFIALSQLGSEDRGLVDKKPAERKRFVNNIIGDELATYNDIYKNVSKQCSELKGLVNSLTMKINNLGDEGKLNSSLVDIKSKLSKLNEEEGWVNKQIGALEQTISSKDPDGSMLKEYDEAKDKLSSYDSSCDLIKEKIALAIKNYSSKYNTSITLEQVNDVIDEVRKLRSDISMELSEMQGKVFALIDIRDNEIKEINTKTAKLKSMSTDVDITEIKNNIDSIKSRLLQVNDLMKDLNIPEDSKISKDEYISGLNTLKDVKETIDSFRSTKQLDDILDAIAYFISNSYPNIDKVHSSIESGRTEVEALSKELIEYEAAREAYKEMESKRPKSCEFKNCGFISDILHNSAIHPESGIERLRKTITTKKAELEDNIKKESRYRELVEIINGLRQISRSLSSNKAILNKLPIDNIVKDPNQLVSKLASGYAFSEIDELYSRIDMANLIEERNVLNDNLTKYESLFSKYSSEMSAINEIYDSIESMNNKLDELNDTISSNKDKMKELELRSSELEGMENILTGIISDALNYNTIAETRDKLLTRMEEIRNSVMDIDSCTTRLNDFQNRLKLLNQSREELDKQKSQTLHDLQTLTEYKCELDQYMSDYAKYDTIKYYSSPNTGIQTEFIRTYMNKVLFIANDMLGLMFGGNYIIQPFIINEDEFRIPCLGNGYINDDISSMSTSEKCMISMIISFALLTQSSTGFNIPRLDEIDGGLDSANRGTFGELLDRLMDMLQCTQCIYISHNLEGSYYDCDVILLRNGCNRDLGSANIIYKYE